MSKPLQKGPRGGTYYISSSGKKVYVKASALPKEGETKEVKTSKGRTVKVKKTSKSKGDKAAEGDKSADSGEKVKTSTGRVLTKRKVDPAKAAQRKADKEASDTRLEAARPPHRVESEESTKVEKAVFGKPLSDKDINELVGIRAELPQGIRAQAKMSAGYGDGGVSMSCDFKDAEGNLIGSLNRSYTRSEDGKLEVKQEYFYIDEDMQGKGLGKQIFKAQIEAYRKHKVDTVHLEAAEVGKYVWTKAGFDWTEPEHKAKIFSDFTTHVTEKYGESAATKLMSKIKTPKDLSRAKIKGDRIGKDFLVNMEADGSSVTPYIQMSQSPKKIKSI